MSDRSRVSLAWYEELVVAKATIGGLLDVLGGSELASAAI